MKVSVKEISKKTNQIFKDNFRNLFIATVLIPAVIKIIVALLKTVIVGVPGSIIQYVISLLITLGIANAVIKVIKTGKSNQNDFLEPFKNNFAIKFGEILRSQLIVILNTFLLIIPGIIKSLQYAVVKYIVVDDEMDSKEAIKLSKNLMQGHKAQYLKLIIVYALKSIAALFIAAIIMVIFSEVLDLHSRVAVVYDITTSNILDVVKTFATFKPDMLYIILDTASIALTVGFVQAKFFVAAGLLYQEIKEENINVKKELENN